MHRCFDNVSVNSKPDHLPGIPTFPLPGGGAVFAQFSLLWDRGFELEEFSSILKEKFRNFSICFQETGGTLKSRCSCAVSYQFLQKQ